MIRDPRVIARAHSENLTVIVDATMAAASVAVIMLIIALAVTPG
jgi:hypothetical protein